MEIRPIRFFLKLAEHLNFGRAARDLLIVQSALSMQIKVLARIAHKPGKQPDILFQSFKPNFPTGAAS